LSNLVSNCIFRNHWLKYTVFENENVEWKDVKKNGELNEDMDNLGIKTIFWCRNLIDIHGQKELLEEAEKSLRLFYNN
jgi:hypothetical protein